MKIRKIKDKEIEYDHVMIWDGAKYKVRRVPKNKVGSKGTVAEKETKKPIKVE